MEYNNIMKCIGLARMQIDGKYGGYGGIHHKAEQELDDLIALIIEYENRLKEENK